MSFSGLPSLSGPGLGGLGLANLPALPNPAGGELALPSTPKTPPSSQKGRPISFLLADRSSPTSQFTSVVRLNIRPEELTRSDPSRVTVHKTLGSAFVDSFGTDLPTINISGHTGWRRDSNNDDGEARFKNLRDTVYVNWHSRRAAAVRDGNDPNLVTLTLIDQLDSFAVQVAPLNFVLRRSRSRPLLLQFQMQLVVVNEDGIGNPSVGPPAAVTQSAGLDSMAASTAQLANASVLGIVPQALVGPLTTFMATGTSMTNALTAQVNTISGASATLLSFVTTYAMAATNLFRTLAAPLVTTYQDMCTLMQIANAWSNIACVLRNCIATQLFYPDYSPLLGSSNCSSTSGGSPLSPLAAVNPFYTVAPQDAPGITVTTQAQNSLLVLAKCDPVLAPLGQTQLVSTTTAIASGVTVAP